MTEPGQITRKRVVRDKEGNIVEVIEHTVAQEQDPAFADATVRASRKKSPRWYAPPESGPNYRIP